MNTLELEAETRRLLDRIRAGADTLMLEDVDSDLAEQAVQELAKPLLEKVRLSRMQQDQHRWFLRELTGLLRTRIGWDLAFELELLLRKWVGYGLAFGLLQALIRQCYSGLTIDSRPATVDSPKSEVQSPLSNVQSLESKASEVHDG